MNTNFSEENSVNKLGGSTNLMNATHFNEIIPSTIIQIKDKKFKRERQKNKYSDIAQEKYSYFKQDIPNISTTANSQSRSMSNFIFKNKESSENLINSKFSTKTRNKKNQNLYSSKSFSGTPCSTIKKKGKMKLSELNNFSSRNLENKTQIFNSIKQQQETPQKNSNGLSSIKNYNNNFTSSNKMYKSTRSHFPNNFENSTNSFYNSKSKNKTKSARSLSSKDLKKSKRNNSSRSFSYTNYVNQKSKQYIGIDLNLVSNASHKENNNFNSQIQRYLEIYNENELNGDINSNNGEIITESNVKTIENVFEIEKNDENIENEIENGDNEQTITYKNNINKNYTNIKTINEVNGDDTLRSKQSFSKNNNSKNNDSKLNLKSINNNNNSNNNLIFIENNNNNNNSKNNIINSSYKKNNKIKDISKLKPKIENIPPKKMKIKEDTQLLNNSNSNGPISHMDNNSFQPISQSTPMRSIQMHPYEAESSPTNYIKSISYINTISYKNNNNNAKYINGKNGLNHITINKSISDGFSLHSINKSKDDEDHEHFISNSNLSKDINKDKEEEKRITEKLEKIHNMKNAYKKQQLRNEIINASQFTITEKDEESDLEIQKKSIESGFISETKKILEKSNINREICDSERETIENEHRLEKLRMQKMKEEEFERNEMINRIKKEQEEIEEKEKKERLEILKKEQKMKEEQILKEIEKQRDIELEEKKLKLKLEEEKIRKKFEQEKLEKYLKEDAERQKQKIEIENKKLIIQKENDIKMKQLQEMKEKLEKEKQLRMNIEKQSKLLEQKFKDEIENNKKIENIDKINNIYSINNNTDNNINKIDNNIDNNIDKNININTNKNINNNLDKLNNINNINEKNNENLDYVINFNNNNGTTRYNKKYITGGLLTDFSSSNNNKNNKSDNFNYNYGKNKDINTINSNENNNTVKSVVNKLQSMKDSYLNKEFLQTSNIKNTSYIDNNDTVTKNITSYPSLRNSNKKLNIYQKNIITRNTELNRSNSQTGFQIEITSQKEKKNNFNKSFSSFSFNIEKSPDKKINNEINKENKEEKIINTNQEENNSKVDDIFSKFKASLKKMTQNNSPQCKNDDIHNNKIIDNKNIINNNSKINKSYINDIYQTNKNNKNSKDLNNNKNKKNKNINSFLNNSNYTSSKFISLFDNENTNKKDNNKKVLDEIKSVRTENNTKKNKTTLIKNKFYNLGTLLEEDYYSNNKNYSNLENDNFFNTKPKKLNDDIIKTNKTIYDKIPHHNNRLGNKNVNLNGSLWSKDVSFNNNITLGYTEQSSGYSLNNSLMNSIINNNKSKMAFNKKNNNSLICPANPFDKVNEAREYFFFND